MNEYNEHFFVFCCSDPQGFLQKIPLLPYLNPTHLNFGYMIIFQYIVHKIQAEEIKAKR